MQSKTASLSTFPAQRLVILSIHQSVLFVCFPSWVCRHCSTPASKDARATLSQSERQGLAQERWNVLHSLHAVGDLAKQRQNFQQRWFRTLRALGRNTRPEEIEIDCAVISHPPTSAVEKDEKDTAFAYIILMVPWSATVRPLGADVAVAGSTITLPSASGALNLTDLTIEVALTSYELTIPTSCGSNDATGKMLVWSCMLVWFEGLQWRLLKFFKKCTMISVPFGFCCYCPHSMHVMSQLSRSFSTTSSDVFVLWDQIERLYNIYIWYDIYIYVWKTFSWPLCKYIVSPTYHWWCSISFNSIHGIGMFQNPRTVTTEFCSFQQLGSGHDRVCMERNSSSCGLSHGLGNSATLPQQEWGKSATKCTV